MHNTKNPLSRQNDLIMQEFVDEILIYDLLTDKAYCLNKTSSIIWQLCDGTKPVNEIADALSEQVGSPVSEDLVLLALEQFAKDKLLEDNDIQATSDTTISRRSVIKKVAMTSAIALPLISSITAPSAAHAGGSCLPDNSPCQVGIPPECCSFCLPKGSDFPGEPGICIGKN